MRHLTRLYFDNVPTATAKEVFISVVDQGVDGSGNPLYSVMPGTISNPMTLTEQYQALRYLQATSCFFKLPVGANATVDIYIPDEFGSAAPKSFDYQVTHARKPDRQLEETAAALNSLKATFEPLMARESANSNAAASGSGGSGTIADIGIGGPCCMNPGSGPDDPCGAQTSIPCEDPLTQRAFCNGTMLECIDNEPEGERKKK